jgi:hypothetical protein
MNCTLIPEGSRHVGDLPVGTSFRLDPKDDNALVFVKRGRQDDGLIQASVGKEYGYIFLAEAYVYPIIQRHLVLSEEVDS